MHPLANARKLIADEGVSVVQDVEDGGRAGAYTGTTHRALADRGPLYMSLV